ncbi:MAG: hypothetical protein WB509_27020 [Acetobacteraceae bacterium]
MRAPSAKLADPNLSLTELATTIGDLWFALNNCYTLNPRHRDEQRGKTQLDQVADRQPQILLINIGSNEGLFMAGFAGDFSDQTIDHPGDSYYFAYGPRIGSTETPIPGTQLRDFDALIADVNARSEDVLKTALGNRVLFADIYAASPPSDGKHYMGRGLAIPGTGKSLNNKPINALLLSHYGGFAGLDNMHPTIPGYATIADVVLGALGRSVKTDKAAAYAADTLLNDVQEPPLLVAQAELSLLGLLGVCRGGGAAAV